MDSGGVFLLEQKIKAELVAQGLLMADVLQPAADDEESEVQKELRKKTDELRTVRDRNVEVVQRLIELCKEQIRCQKLRKEMVDLNSALMEAYKKYQSNKVGRLSFSIFEVCRSSKT